MEATATTRDRDLRVPRRALVREPLLWAAVAAFVGAALGLAGTFALASVWWDDLYASGPSFAMFALAAPGLGEALALASLAGVAGALWAVLPRKGRAAVCGGFALVLLLFVAHAVTAAYAVYLSTGDRWESFAPVPFPGLIQASFWGTLLLPPIALVAFAGAAFLGHERRLGAALGALCVLSVPLGVVGFLIFSPDPTFARPSRAALVFGWEAPGVGLPEAILWALLGIWLARGARGRAGGEEFRAREKANVRAARRLYEEGLGAGNVSVVDELVSEDFRDLKSGAHGRLGMERAFSALRRSYPDLAVSIEGQEAVGDLVRTRLLLSGTDEGGAMWYPPTGRRVSFSAEFADRFRGGLLVEHAGEADTGELLRQLGHPAQPDEEGSPPGR